MGLKKINNDLVFAIDGTIVRAHQHAAGARGGQEKQGIGRSAGGLTSKLHIRIVADGNPDCIILSAGQKHDITKAEELCSDISSGSILLADKGYQGIVKIHEKSEVPIKKPRGKKYTDQQRKYNRELGRIRVAVENVNRCLKIFKILSYPYRNRRYKFGLRSHLIAGIYNNDLGSKA